MILVGTGQIPHPTNMCSVVYNYQPAAAAAGGLIEIRNVAFYGRLKTWESYDRMISLSMTPNLTRLADGIEFLAIVYKWGDSFSSLKEFYGDGSVVKVLAYCDFFVWLWLI